MIVDVLKHFGTLPSSKLVLKMSVKTGASCSAHCLSVNEETLSGPAAFRLFCILEICFYFIICYR